MPQLVSTSLSRLALLIIVPVMLVLVLLSSAPAYAVGIRPLPGPQACTAGNCHGLVIKPLPGPFACPGANCDPRVIRPLSRQVVRVCVASTNLYWSGGFYLTTTFVVFHKAGSPSYVWKTIRLAARSYVATMPRVYGRTYRYAISLQGRLLHYSALSGRCG